MRVILSIFSVLLVFLFSCENMESEQQYTQEQLDSIQQVECDSVLFLLREHKADTVGRIESIPTDIEGCLAQLDTLFNEEMKGWIRCLPDMEFVSAVHNTLGSYLRTNWGLWRENELAVSLYKMGIIHPDDMTAIILTCYQRKIKGEDIKLEEQIKYYQDYWRDYNVPVDSLIKAAASK